MRNRCRAVAGVALITSLALTIAGCGDSSGPGASTSPTPAGPEQALLDSAKAISEGNFMFNLTTPDINFAGTVHAPSKSAGLAWLNRPADKDGLRVGVRTIGNDRWVKIESTATTGTVADISNKWLHIDPAKLTSPRARRLVSIDFGGDGSVDPLGAVTVLHAAVTVEPTSDGDYSGTVDLTQATEAGMVNPEIVAARGEKAKAVPFKARLDDHGRLEVLSLTIPAVGDAREYSIFAGWVQYGAMKPNAPPPGETREAPEAAYEYLNR